jgi:putative oxidoreductase
MSDNSVFILRLAFGSMLLAHSLLKIFVFTVAGTAAYFVDIGLPAIFAYLTIFVELFGGVAIIFGLYTRLFSLASIPVMLGAFWVHYPNGWLFSNHGGGYEYPLFLVCVAIALSLSGNGSFSLKKISFIDRFIPEKLK